MKFTELKQHLSEKGVQPIYLFEGEELYFREKGKAMIKAFVAQPDFNYTVYDKRSGLKELVASVFTLPFLSEKRMVVAEEFYPTEKEYSQIKQLFETPVDTSVLVIVNSGAKKAGACDLKKKPNVTYVDCARADDAMVTKWIFITFKRANIAADGGVCNAIQQYCCSDMARVEKEVEKLKEYAGEGGKITLRDVNELVYKDSEYKLYELTQAAARKDYTQFVQIMDSMVGKGFDENAFLNSLCAYFRTLAEVSAFQGNDQRTAEALGMKEYAVKKSREQVARFPKGMAQSYYTEIYETLAAAREGKITFPTALKTVVEKIFFKTY
jgi:DNA polymerase-3 subunit delta